MRGEERGREGRERVDRRGEERDMKERRQEEWGIDGWRGGER